MLFRTRIDHEGGARPVEVIEALTGAAPGEEVRFARTGLWGQRGGEQPFDPIDPLDLPAVAKAQVAPAPAPAPAGPC